MATAKDWQEDAERLGHRLSEQRKDLERSESYYDADWTVASSASTLPPEQRRPMSGAAALVRVYLDAIEERLDVSGFRLAGESSDVARFWDWWQRSNLDERSGLVHFDALLAGCGFVTVTAPPDGGDVPVIRPQSPAKTATEGDPRTGEISRAILTQSTPPDVPNVDRDAQGYAIIYSANEVAYLQRAVNGSWSTRYVEAHGLGAVPVVSFANRARSTRLGGLTEVTKELRELSDIASRIVQAMSGAAELMAVPQRVLAGVESEKLGKTPVERDRAYMSRILAFSDPDVTATQFPAAELRNYVDALRELVRHAAAYTGLPPQYLSTQSDNATSAEAIRASESRLVRKCERKQVAFGGAWEQVMRLGLQIIDGHVPDEYNRLETQWRDPSTPTVAARADAVYKMYDKGDGIIPKDYARRALGYTPEERAEMEQLDAAAPTTLDNLLRQTQPEAG